MPSSAPDCFPAQPAVRLPGRSREGPISARRPIPAGAGPITPPIDRVWPFNPEETYPLAWWRTLPSRPAARCRSNPDRRDARQGRHHARRHCFGRSLARRSGRGRRGGGVPDADRRSNARGRHPMTVVWRGSLEGDGSSGIRGGASAWRRRHPTSQKARLRPATAHGARRRQGMKFRWLGTASVRPALPSGR